MVWGTGRIHVSGKEMGKDFGEPLGDFWGLELWQKQLTPMCPRGPGGSCARAGRQGVLWSRTRGESAATWWTNNWRPDGKVDSSGEASMDGEWSWGPDVPSQYLALCKPPKFRGNPGKGERGEVKLIENKFLQPQRNGGLKRKKQNKELYFWHTWILWNEIDTCYLWSKKQGFLLTIKKRQKEIN